MQPTRPVPPTLTIENVIFQFVGEDLAVLIGKAVAKESAGQWALPGGYCAKGETTLVAMGNILRLKAGLDIKSLGLIEQLYTFDTVEDDGKSLAISVTFLSLGKNLHMDGGTTGQEPAFVPVKDLPPLAYNHQEVVDYALTRLRSKITYTTAVSALLPDQFTIAMLHAAYETILGHKLDIRNFRKKYIAYGVLEATDEMFADAAHRPARYYRFKYRTLQTLSRDFE